MDRNKSQYLDLKNKTDQELVELLRLDAKTLSDVTPPEFVWQSIESNLVQQDTKCQIGRQSKNIRSKFKEFFASSMSMFSLESFKGLKVATMGGLVMAFSYLFVSNYTLSNKLELALIENQKLESQLRDFNELSWYASDLMSQIRELDNQLVVERVSLRKVELLQQRQQLLREIVTYHKEPKAVYEI